MASTSPSVRLAAMHAVQRAAMDLFEARGFDDVSVADVARAAGVAPRSVYRYFGTKEGIVLWNASDEDFLDGVTGLLGGLGLRDALREVAGHVDHAVSAEQQEISGRQVALIDATPQLQAKLAASVQDAGRVLGVAVARARGRADDDRESRQDAGVAVTVLFAATLDWERTGRRGRLSGALHAALDSLESWPSR